MSRAAQEPPTPAEELKLAEAIAAQPDEPLLPVEKKLIAGSLILGIALLGLLIWLSNTFFPVPAGPG
jgi:hypothetical protein